MIWLKLAAVLAWSGLMFWWGGSNERLAGQLAAQMERTRAEKTIAKFAKAKRDAVQRARKAEQAAADGIAAAQDEADKRDDQIEADYARRVAGVAAERDKLRQLWRDSQATDRLAEDATAAGAAAEKDRLRRESAARIVRAVERVQSERDEVIDRYEAVRKAAGQ